eukprot:3790701-Pyramimonas_sp.AAC.1
MPRASDPLRNLTADCMAWRPYGGRGTYPSNVSLVIFGLVAPGALEIKRGLSHQMPHYYAPFKLTVVGCISGQRL